jgi:hypothetical protein
MSNNESEFAGRQHLDTTLPREPRRLRRDQRLVRRRLTASDKLRLGYTTGDETGESPRDGGRAWRGEAKADG